MPASDLNADYVVALRAAWKAVEVCRTRHGLLVRWHEQTLDEAVEVAP